MGGLLWDIISDDNKVALAKYQHYHYGLQLDVPPPVDEGSLEPTHEISVLMSHAPAGKGRPDKW